MSETTTGEVWQGLAGCGCLTIVIAIFFPPSLFVMIPAFIIYLIVAMILSPFSIFQDRKRKAEDKIIVEKFEAAWLAEAADLPETVNDVQVNVGIEQEFNAFPSSSQKYGIAGLLESVIFPAQSGDYSRLEQFVADIACMDMNATKVFQEISESAQEGNADCSYFLALYFLKIRNYPVSGKWLGKAVALKHPLAIQMLKNLKETRNYLSGEQRQQLEIILSAAAFNS